MKIEGRLIGRVEEIEEASIWCSMYDQSREKRFVTRLYPEVLAGLVVGDEFEMKTTVEVTKLEPKPISKEEVEAVRKDFENRWTF